MESLQQRVLLLSGVKRWAVAFVAGLIASLGLAPLHLFVAGFIAFPLIVWLLDGAVGFAGEGALKRLRPAFAVGWWFGFGYFIAGLWWIANALLVEARDFIWFIPLAVVGLPAILALFYGAACALARVLWSDGLGRIAALAFAFGLMELARGYVATGFPWNAIGQTIMPVPVMMQSVSVIGAEAMNALAVFVFALPAAMVSKNWRAAMAGVLSVGLLAAHLGFGLWRLSAVAEVAAENDVAADMVRMRIVQPSIDQSTKTAGTDTDDQFALLLDLTSLTADDGRNPDVIIWPETAVPFILTRSPEAVSAIAARLQPGQRLVTGAVRVEGDEGEGADQRRYYNSITVLDDEGIIIDAADKVHLVPFGEYLPFKDLLGNLGLRAVAAADRGYSAAPDRTMIEPLSGIRLLPLICYEAIFARHAVFAGDQPAAILNVSNDAWYGNTPGPYQHMHQSRLRGIEQGVPLIRAANSGISGAFDGHGRPLMPMLGYHVQGAADFDLPMAGVNTLYSQHGFRYLWLILFAFASIALVASLRMKSSV